MCNKLSLTFRNFLKHGWIVPLVSQVMVCIIKKLVYFFYRLYKRFI